MQSRIHRNKLGSYLWLQYICHGARLKRSSHQDLVRILAENENLALAKVGESFGPPRFRSGRAY